MFNPLSLFSRRSQRRWFYPVISFIVALGLWLGNPAPSQAIPWLNLILRGVQVIQLSSMSDRQEVEIGRQINDQLVRQEIRLYRNADLSQYVDQIGQRLANRSDRSNLPYTFQIVDDKRVNAFATMGGFVYVTTGLMQTADNEAELAGVIGHEIGHITKRHSVQQMRQVAIAQGVAAAAGLDRSVAVQIGVDLALRRPNSRQDEFEADAQGLDMLGRAGYAQTAMVTFMEKLLRSSSVPTFLSTHPATSDRITALNRQISARQTTGNEGLNQAAYRSRIQPLLRS